MTGKQLQEWREKGDLSQLELERATGIHQTTLSLIENGYRQLSPKQEAAVRRVILSALRARSAEVSKAVVEAERVGATA